MEWILYDGFVEYIPYDENIDVIEFIEVDTIKVGFSINLEVENDERVVTALLVVVRRGTKIKQISYIFFVIICFFHLFFHLGLRWKLLVWIFLLQVLYRILELTLLVRGGLIQSPPTKYSFKSGYWLIDFSQRSIKMIS